MAQQVIITVPENSGEGTPLATAFDYCNSNFSELYSRVQAPPPSTLVGSAGDQAGMYAYDPTYFYYCFADYDGSSTIWAQVQQAGNISATQIQYGNTIVDIASPGANVTIGVHGSYNRVVFSNTTAFFNTAVYANANLTVVGTTFSNAIQASGNIRGNTVYSNVFLHTGGTVSAVGNIITDAYFIGDGSQLTGLNTNSISNGLSDVAIPVTDGNVTVAVGGPTVGTFSSDGLSVVGNIESSYFLGNGYYLTGISGGSGNYGNANVAAYLPTYTGNLQSGNLNVNNNFYIGNTAFTRTLTVGTRTTPVTQALASNNSFNVLARTGNVVVYTT